MSGSCADSAAGSRNALAGRERVGHREVEVRGEEQAGDEERRELQEVAALAGHGDLRGAAVGAVGGDLDVRRLDDLEEQRGQHLG
jgi:hypothetical protein